MGTQAPWGKVRERSSTRGSGGGSSGKQVFASPFGLWAHIPRNPCSGLQVAPLLPGLHPQLCRPTGEERAATRMRRLHVPSSVTP